VTNNREVKLESNKFDPEISAILATVSDPEIPVLTVLDLGVVRSVSKEGTLVTIKLTPTYSGCPAMDTMATDIAIALDNAGYASDIKLVLSPAWTTDWISEDGRRKLEEYGVAAPLTESMDKRVLYDGAKIVKCTNCQSTNTKMKSQFGSTACKALFQCEDCLEPFDYFKCLK